MDLAGYHTGSMNQSLGGGARMSENGAGYEDLGFAKLDTNREQRTGFPEVVFCEDKPDAYLPEIFQRLVAADGRALGTRASERQAGLVREVLPRQLTTRSRAS